MSPGGSHGAQPFALIASEARGGLHRSMPLTGDWPDLACMQLFAPLDSETETSTRIRGFRREFLAHGRRTATVIAAT